jgi:large subunit ribosomal protein L5
MSNEEQNKPEAEAEKPGAEKPGAEKPGAEKPGAEKPGAEKPGAEKPGAEKPGAEKPEAAPAPGGEETQRIDPQVVKAAKKEKKEAAKAMAQAKKAAAQGGPVPSKKGKGKDKKKGKKSAADPFVKRTEPPRLKTRFSEEVVPAMMKKFGYSSPMAVPRLVKITLNMGLGEALQNAKLLDSAEDELTVIAGQHPVITRARKSIATFKLRQGQKIGAMVTLRRDRMYEFLDRLVSFALPRTRDFKGVSPKSFDGRGNFSLGIREQIIFPEIDYDKIEKIKGLNISIVTTARTDEEGKELLRHFGMPFR